MRNITKHKQLSLNLQAFWSLVIAAAWVGASIQVCLTVQRYLRYETHVAVKILNDPDTPFPAVTICSFNAIAVHGTYVQ